MKRPPFSWSDSKFTTFFLLRFIFFTAGTTIIPFVVRRTNLTGKEMYMIVGGVAAAVAINMITCFAHNSTQIMWSELCFDLC